MIQRPLFAAPGAAAPTGWRRLSGLWLLSLYLAVVLNLPVLWRRARSLFAASTESVASSAWAMVGELLLLISLVALLAHLSTWVGRWGWRLLLLALLPVSALCAYYMARYGVVIGYGVVSATLTTDHHLSTEVIDLGTWASLLLLGLLPLVLLWRAPVPPSLWAQRRTPRALLGRLATVGLLVLAFQGAQALLGHHGRQALARSGEAAPNPVGVAAHSYVPSNWIAGAGMWASNAWSAQRTQQRLIDPARHFQWQARAALNDLVLVFVVGETARHDRFGLLGHTRDTTPRLAAMPELAAFAGTSCDTSTKLSLACMFVRPEAVKEDPGMGPDVITEDNVFSVLKHLGFGIELYAMQSEVGFYNRTKADFYKFREVIVAEPHNANQPITDLMLLPELKAALARHARAPTPRPLALVLHTKGSHYLYTQRYPRSFARFQPECQASDTSCTREQFLNSFDNTILFTDHVLAEAMAALQGRKALLVYSSDHGESIDDNSHLHGTPRRMAPPEQRAVPLIFWGSPALRADAVLGPAYARLKARAAAGQADTGHHNLFASLLGCLGVESPNGGITPAHNLCR